MSRSHNPRLGQTGGVEVFCGIDEAGDIHHAVALDRAGRRLVDRPLPNDEAALRKLFRELAARGRLLMVVDQPASIGALAIAVARSMLASTPPRRAPRSTSCRSGCETTIPDSSLSVAAT